MDLIYRLYGLLHRLAKFVISRGKYEKGAKIYLNNKIELGVSSDKAKHNWMHFIKSSLIQDDDKFAGCLYAGYVAEKNEWILPSWIWTNAASIRVLCSNNEVELAIEVAEELLKRQESCGGWVVRNDYDYQGEIPMLAPNDSAYIANNAFVELYLATREKRYLDAAVRCADWIMETSRTDGMVYVGYNMRDKKWDKSCVIVDVGFTGALFSRLYNITHEQKYYAYLSQFVKRYIELFYLPASRGFCTNIDCNDLPRGGMFSRGQAWALEGLIPAYLILKEDFIKNVIRTTIETILKKQNGDGGWSGNFTRGFRGSDNKGIPILAKCIMAWNSIEPDERYTDSAKRALQWCYKHTAKSGEAKGGIFSYSWEGGIVKDFYTSCAFVYGSAYAIELEQMLKQ